MTDHEKSASTNGRSLLDLRPEVIWFALQMEGKLRENDHKEGWRDEHLFYLINSLDRERRELWEALNEPDLTEKHAREIIRECADVANFALMIADVVRLRWPRN